MSVPIYGGIPAMLRQFGQLDRANDRPPYKQIASMLREAIEDGRYGPGDRLPSEAELINHFGVARMTVRLAVQELRVDGLAFSEHGKGVFVQPRAQHPFTADTRMPLGAAPSVECRAAETPCRRRQDAHCQRPSCGPGGSPVKARSHGEIDD
jgi:DNA-binding FadR family transcriptional regulator